MYVHFVWVRPSVGPFFSEVPLKRVALFGSTGSIGRNTLDVVRALPDRFQITHLSAFKDIETLERQALEFRPAAVAVVDPGQAAELRKRLPRSIDVWDGHDGLIRIAQSPDSEIVVSGLVGFAGVLPTAEAIRHGKDVALANKETLVAAGSAITSLVREHGVRLLPVDSEHSAILQCLAGERHGDVAKLLLTASGGPFRTLPAQDFRTITVQDALRHPNWSMGRKITVDSATLMNKGLEVIEAHWLFGLDLSRIEVVIHPQSIIHSMVEFVDGSVKAQLGLPDMKLPIQYALTYPERLFLDGGRVSFPRLKEMTFEEPDRQRFPLLQIAYDAMSAGGTAPAVLNAANEIAVRAFLGERLSFTGIASVVRETLERVPQDGSADLETILDADRVARESAERIIQDSKDRSS